MTDSVTIENLTIDDVTYVVGDLSDDIQQAVRKYEEWRDRFAVAQDEVALVGAALRDLGAQIVAAVRNEEEQKAAEAVAEVEAVVTEDTPEPVVTEDTPELVVTEDTPEPVASDTLVVDDAAE